MTRTSDFYRVKVEMGLHRPKSIWLEVGGGVATCGWYRFRYLINASARDSIVDEHTGGGRDADAADNAG
jgi:hypothetical protein